MPLNREERKLLHQKAKQPTSGVGKPDNREGYDGDISFRKIDGSGTVEYVKTSGEWVAIASSGEMPPLRIIGSNSSAGAGTGVTVHHGLSGLGDDDHTQYLLVDGTRAVTGDLSLSGGDGALTFTVAGENSIKIPDNQASALIIEEANNAYLTFNTANSGGEKITLGKKLEAGSVEIEGTAFDINGGDISAATISGGLTWSAAQDLNNQNLTNADIDSGAIDGTTIGASSATTIKGTTIDATTDFTIDGLVITADDITNDAALEIQTAAGDITLDPGGNNVLPGSDDADDLGKSDQQWKDLYIDGVAYIDTLNADALGANLDHANYNSTNVDIDSGAIDGTAIGASSQAAGDFTAIGLVSAGTIAGTTIDATTDFTIGSLVITDDSIVMTPSTSDTVTISAATNGVLNITTVDNAAASANIVITADGTLDLNSVALDIDASGAIAIDSTSTILISGDAGATFSDDTEAIIYDGSGNLDFDAVALDMDLTDSSSITITSSENGEDLTIAQVGANNSSIIITAAGTGADAISIDATAGSMVIGASLVDQKTLTIGNTSSTYLKLLPHDTIGSELILLHNAAGDDDESIKIHSVAGGITVLSGGGMFLDAETVSIGDAGDVPVQIDSTTFDLNASSWIRIDGNAVSIDGTDDSNITVTGSNKDLTLSVAGGSTQTLTISSAGTGTNAIDINATAGGVDIDANGAISLDSAAGSIDINVVDGQTVNVGLNGAVETIWTPHGTAGSELWSTINTAGTTDGSDSAGAILLSSVAGGIGLAWADDKDLWAEGGRAIITANEDAAECIKLHADAGSSQTILVQNDAGTHATEAIQLKTNAGGISIAAKLDLTLTADGGNIYMSDAGANLIDFDLDNTTITLHDDQDTGDKVVMTVTQHGAFSIVTTDDDAAAANIQITADGTAELAGTTVTLDSSDDIAINADGGNVVFSDGSQQALNIDMDDTAGDAVFKDAGDAEIFRIDGSENSVRFTGYSLTNSDPYAISIKPLNSTQHMTMGLADKQNNYSMLGIYSAAAAGISGVTADGSFDDW